MHATNLPPARILKVVALVACLMFLICGTLLTPRGSADVSNENAAPVLLSGPEVDGQWSSVITLPIVAIHMHMLPNGKVLIWQDDDRSPRVGGQTVAYIWDVGAGTTTQINNTTKNVFCSGHAFLPDGRLLVAGGHDTQDGDGIPDAFIFNSSNNTWTQTNLPMALGRWYPSAVTVGNGEIVVVSGTEIGNGIVATPEV